MSQVDTAAVWIGLVAGIVSTVLAIVAMTFTFMVDRRSRDINDQMIKSLQKIESSVEGVAASTTNLIKVAWERMLPRAVHDSPQDVAEADESVRAIAAGMAAELRAELGPQAKQDGQEAIEKLENAMKRLERTVGAQLSSSTQPPVNSAERFVRLQTQLERLSPLAREVARQLAHSSQHLTRAQYGALRHGELGEALVELQRNAILGPLKGTDADGSSIPVYYLPPGTHRFVVPVLAMMDPIPRQFRDKVRHALLEIEYPAKDDS